MMIKVLIVDDEPKLREGLKTIVPWSELGFQIADTAANGTEALDKFRQYRPGLICVDIRMPGMDGLELIEAVRDIDPEVHLLILSGYADFEYAKRAIRKGVDGYLLKPVDEEELKDHLLQIRQKLDQKLAASALDKAASAGSREALLQALLLKEPVDEGLLRHARDRGWLGDRCQPVLLQVHEGTGEVEAEPNVRLRRELTETFEEAGRGIVFSLNACLGVLLRHPVRSSLARRELHNEFQHMAVRAGTTITAALGSPAEDPVDLPSSYRDALELLKHRFFYAEEELLWSGSARFGEGADFYGEQGYDPAAMIEQMYYAVDIGKVENLLPLTESAARTMVQEGFSEEMMKTAFVELLTGVVAKQARHHGASQTDTAVLADRIAAIYRERTASGLCSHAARFLKERIQPAGSDNRPQEIKRILDLIHRNYSDNLKLETLAAVFNYNSAYLGKLFRQATGEYFNTYLDRVRIEKAKDHLKQGMKVYQVAEKVGYTNADYFHSKFKKYVGTSPSIYRKERE